MPSTAKTKRRVALAIAATVMVVVALLILWPLRDPLRWPARRQWKDQAITRIQQRLDDPAWLERERALLSPIAASRPSHGRWIGDELLVMENGDWIICQSVSSKQNWRIQDLFIGQGSDGKWYYSTFHFCVGKQTLMMESRPESLAEFVDEYRLVPFDGRSDESLKRTWP